MKKQIIYPKFIQRLFASTIDLFLISTISPYIMNIFAKIIYSYAFRDYLLKVQSEGQLDLSLSQVFYSPAFFEYLTASTKTTTYLICILTLTLINFILMGTYFISFWKYLGATPGKLVMSMRVVDVTTLGKPSTYQLIKRFCGYLTAAFGIWSILFTANRQALHDKISSTLVTKA